MQTYTDVIRGHGLQVVLKGLPPFDSGLELMHFDQVVWMKKQHMKHNSSEKHKVESGQNLTVPPQTEQLITRVDINLWSP